MLMVRRALPWPALHRGKSEEVKSKSLQPSNCKTGSGQLIITCIIYLFVLIWNLAEVVWPVGQVEGDEGDGEDGAGQHVDLLGSELPGVQPEVEPV